jgi:cytochrome c oxidase subunit 2
MSELLSSDSSGHSPQRAFDSTSKLAAFMIGVAAVVGGIAMAVFNPFLTGAASTQGALIDTLFSVTLGIGTAVFIIVQGFLIYSIVRFARQPGDEGDGLPIRGNTRLEIVWTAIPAIVVVFIGAFSYRTLAALDLPQPGEMTVEVKAMQYDWEFYYPDYDVTSKELHIPLDEPVFLKMRSNDVIHSFWVPAFRMKKDVLPDRITETRITGTELGAFPIVCAELCGAGHAIMRSQVIVHSDAEFKQWLASEAAAGQRRATSASTDPSAHGRQLFTQYGCDACHVLTDAGAAGQVGPSLDGIGSRASTEVPGQSAEDFLRASIVKPNDHIIKSYPPGVMPQDYGQRMSDPDLDALEQYLLMQK